MELVRLHQPEVRRLAHGLASRRVELQLHGEQRVAVVNARVVEPVVGGLVALPTHGPDQLNHRVGEGQLHAGLSAANRLHQREHLRDQLLEVRGSEAVALDHIQEYLRAVDSRLKIVVLHLATTRALHHHHIPGRHHNAVSQLLKVHRDLATRKHDRHQWQRVARRLREVERKRHVQRACRLRVRNQIRSALALANHLRQALAWLAGQLLPHVQVVVVHGVDGLRADDQLRGLHNQLANCVRPVAVRLLLAQAGARQAARVASAVVRVAAAATVVLLQPASSATLHGRVVRLVRWAARVRGIDGSWELLPNTTSTTTWTHFNTRDLQHNVQEVQQITGLVQFCICRFTKSRYTIKVLDDGQHRKVSVSQVAEAPKRQGRRTRQQRSHDAAGC